MADGNLILIVGGLLAAGLVASLLAVRLRVPGLVLFLALGMLVGSDGAGWIEFDDYRLARTVGVIALAIILFEGGLTSGLVHVRQVLAPAASLALVGTIVTALLTGLAAAALFDLSAREGLLVGAILSSTDGAAVFALLRGSTLTRRLARTLEAESGLNDPVAVLLVLACMAWLTDPGYGFGDALWLFVCELGIGALVGGAVGWLAVQGFRRARLASAGLYPVASLAAVALAYGAADSLQGSGFLAVYLAGLALGSANVPAKQTTATFHEGLALVAQLALFLTLGLLVFPHRLGAVALEGTLLALFLVLVARPLAALAATIGFGYSGRERLLLGWAGLRGAVPVVLATFPVIAHVPHSGNFFDIVFFAVVVSTLLQGSTTEALARRLGLTTKRPALPRPLADAGTIRGLGAEVLEYPVGEEDAVVGARVRDLALPRDAVVNVIVRGETAIPPRGSTVLRAGDRLHVLVSEGSARAVRELTERWESGPVGPLPRPPRPRLGRRPIFTSWPWDAGDGDPARPAVVRGVGVVEQLRIRRDEPGGLFVLADGRYAVTGRRAVIGGRADLADWARRRMRRAPAEEQAWLDAVIGALAAEAGGVGRG